MRGCDAPAATASNVLPLSPDAESTELEEGDECETTEGPGDQADAQRIVKNFVKSIVRGQEVEVLSTSGGSATCTVSLNKKLTIMTLQRGKSGKKREIPLETIKEVAIGSHAAESVPELPIDDMCVTFVLVDNGGVLSYRFANNEDRDIFAMCVALFVDGRKTECERQAEKRRAKGR